MTDTVNARERVEAFLNEWARRGATAGNGDILYSLGMSDGTLDLTMTDVRAMLAAAPKAVACRECGGKGYTEYEGGDGEGYASHPVIENCSLCTRPEAPKAEPVAHSAEYRSDREDYLNPAIGRQYEAPKVEQEPVAWWAVDQMAVVLANARTLRMRLKRRSRSEAFAHGSIAPELLRRSEEIFDALHECELIAKPCTHPAPASDELLEALEKCLDWVDADSLLHEHIIGLLTKHKGPQS